MATDEISEEGSFTHVMLAEAVIDWWKLSSRYATEVISVEENRKISVQWNL